MLIAAAAAPGVLAAEQQRSNDPQRSGPNIIYILADDLGWSDLGCYGSEYYETPHIDRLASQGLRLTNYHNCQNCQPTRAALLSGQYAPRTGIYTVGGIERFNWQSRPLRPVDNVAKLPLDLETFADRVGAAGYATGMFGKWHLGNDAEHHPGRRGFQEAIATNGKHFDFPTDPKTDYPEGQYLADFLTDRAVDFIRRHRDEPFLLYLPHFGVHSPFQAEEEWIAHFRKKQPAGGHGDPVYAAMIASVDESVGRILDLLDELQLADETVVIFSSDNGGLGGYSREGIAARDVTDNSPLRSGKGSLYEGGIRVPFIVRWPGQTPEGSQNDEPTIHVDVYPTFLELAGAAKPDGQTLDGVSMVPIFRQPSGSLGREAIYQHFPGYLGSGNNTWRTTPVSLIQSGPWKLMEFLEDGRLELYNLQQDIGETKNLAEEAPDRTTAMHRQLIDWRESVGAKMPTRNENIRSDGGRQGRRRANRAAQREGQ